MHLSTPLAMEVDSSFFVSILTAAYFATGTNGHCVLDDAYHYLAERSIEGRTRTIKHPLPRTPDSISADSGVEMEVRLS